MNASYVLYASYIGTALKAAWCEMLALGITAYALVEFRYRKLKRAAKC